MRLPASTFRTRLVWGAALFFVAGLAACQSLKNVSDVNANTHVRETIDLLQEGAAAAGLRAGLRDINAWQLQLRAADDPVLDGIASTLDDLEAVLQAETVDGAKAGRILRSLGEQTQTVARREEAPDRLNRLGAVLVQASQQL